MSGIRTLTRKAQVLKVLESGGRVERDGRLFRLVAADGADVPAWQAAIGAAARQHGARLTPATPDQLLEAIKRELLQCYADGEQGRRFAVTETARRIATLAALADAKPPAWCAYDLDECTVTLAFDTEAEVRSFTAGRASRRRVRVLEDAGDDASGDEYFIVWNPMRNEGFVTNDERDARWTATGHSGGGFGVPSLGEAFREAYEAEGRGAFEVQTVCLPAVSQRDKEALR